MAKQKSDAEWVAIFASFDQSDLPVNQFCKQNGFSPSTFYAKRRDLKNKITSSTSNFLPAQLVDEPRDTLFPSKTIVINVKHASLSLPANTPATYVLELLRGLS